MAVLYYISPSMHDESFFLILAILIIAFLVGVK